MLLGFRIFPISWIKGILAVLLIMSAVFSVYNFVYSKKILPNIVVGPIKASGMTAEELRFKLGEKIENLEEEGLTVNIEGEPGIVYPKNIDFEVDVSKLVGEAFSIGRSGPWYWQLQDRIKAPFSSRTIGISAKINQNKLDSELEILGERFNVAKKDIRYKINGTRVQILTDKKIGKMVDFEKAEYGILSHLNTLDTSAVEVVMKVDPPVVNADKIDLYKRKAEKIMAERLALLYGGMRFDMEREKIGSWIVSDYIDYELVPSLDRRLISEYVVSMASKIDTVPQDALLEIKDGKAIEFTPPRQGKYLAQDETVELIMDSLLARIDTEEVVRDVFLPVIVKRASGNESAVSLGIFELIGKATTPFTGSPANRIWNIQNGTKFLSGLLVAPGEEFSTVGALGEIDNTTGYLPELVIKGDSTIPEFGGGLCQVSSTLFRAVLNSGLPVTERRNHSYRVPYYEYDGMGNYIGPGLDATIYSTNPDFKFKNDTSSHILIQGYVEGDRVTFELYGTSDGRRSEIEGPRTLSSTPPGDPIYIETDTLPEGQTKKIDSAHPGGVAAALYKIIYSDGKEEIQEFKSYYRNWPEKYLIGIKKTGDTK
ncbi:MAG: hypothetical protein A3B96_00995 [Candidatus Spechtbacteria bacterium RIFCSPHIGHO2_02_FULL_43_15b]|uniref:YoaR-like putative peptidoglycan binding domain-containing protein n=1 Tax=Candidatus Spechtbacteria bacterium RIFCSPHIGHO2_01_FULL_43_30 TaxID=1802158 RepID=A0A1G2H7K7_9BACT|nr:MAG: hypothetical protein A2827_02300 [Candidatus Spechtbacteria bacterium RIFCSPHIGHO2_01_FULL_43_30]OGZ58992.1 MAG: hypothetical protein A3B96_00995 [Candidatus Spechtbacteria bacterium RIFCSPHIGHO2_02_FULL_43_15b]